VPATDDRYPFAPGSLTAAGDAPALYGRYPQYRDVLDWTAAFITRPDPGIGRAGPVCPRVAPALERGLVHLVAVPVTASSPAEAAEKGIRLTGLFRDLFPGPGQARAGALLAVFPGLDPRHAGEFIDGGHRLLRTRFTHAGLMLGEFHPDSTVAAARNPAFPVMRCPVPMYAVRAISAHDLMFLDRPGPGGDAAIAPYLRHYLRHLPQAPAARALRARLAALGDSC
jgi:hypothetical protein